MPYKIVYSPEGYYVVDKKNKHRFSNNPLTADQAQKQLKALYIHANHPEPKGGDLVPQFIKNIPSFVSSIPGRLSGIRMDYRPVDRKFLEQYGKCRIKNIAIFRKPVLSFVTPILNAISFGSFSKLMKENNIDTLFHLYLAVWYMDDNVVRGIKIEKNEVITISPLTAEDQTGKYIERCNILLRQDVMNKKNDDGSYGLLIKDFLENTRQYMGDDKFFKYDPANNNCQYFVRAMLYANGLLQDNPEAEPFIYQDMTELESMMFGTTHRFAKSTTNFASVVNTMLEGKGF